MADEAEEVVETPAVEPEAPQETPTETPADDMLNPGDVEAPPESPEEAEAGEQKATEKPADGPQLSVDLLEKAKSLGWDESVLSGIDPVKAEVMILRAQLARATPPPEQKKADEPAVPDLKIELPADIDPEVRKSFETMNTHYAKQVADLRGQLAGVLQHVQQTQLAEVTKRLDNMFGGLGEEYHEILGKGGMDEVANTPAGKARAKVIESMDLLERGYAARGQKIPSEKELFRAALAIAAPLDTKKLANQELSKKLKDGKKTLLVRQNNRHQNVKEPGYDKAVESVAKMMESYGQSSEKFE